MHVPKTTAFIRCRCLVDEKMSALKSSCQQHFFPLIPSNPVLILFSQLIDAVKVKSAPSGVSDFNIDYTIKSWLA